MSKLNKALWYWGDSSIKKTVEAAEELVRLLRDQLAELEADRDRLDYLQRDGNTVYEVYKLERVPTTEANTSYEEKKVHLGWSISNNEDEFPTVRGAIDVAMKED